VNYALCGRRQEGKTTMALYLGRRIRRQLKGHAVVFFDPKRSLRTIRSTSDYEELSEIMEAGQVGEVAFVPPFAFNAEEPPKQIVQESFVGFVQTLAIEEHLGSKEPARRNLSPIVVVVDEAWNLQDAREMQPHLAGLVRLADKEKVFLIQATHRPSEFSTTYRAQVDVWFFFRQWLPSDLDSVEEACGQEVAHIVARLPRHHVVRYDVNSGQFSVWDKPEAWHISIREEEAVEPTHGIDRDRTLAETGL
jgi:DNA helicase HerA-like ATPase